MLKVSTKVMIMGKCQIMILNILMVVLNNDVCVYMYY